MTGNASGLELIRPDTAGYDEARRTFNATIDRRPSVIARPASVSDVSDAVRLAADEGLPIAVRGGGHAVAGHAVADGALVVDLSRLRGVSVDPVGRRARVEGGALWDDIDPAMTAHGLVFPGGTFGDTGVGGLTLGGGIGWLLGTLGLTCDSLVGAEVVLASGATVVAGEGGDPDLLWALRGGGGNFGVVTTFVFALHELPKLYAGLLELPLTREVLLAVVEVQASAPAELEMMVDVSQAPGNGAPILVGVCYQGVRDAAERILAPIRSAGVIGGELREMSYLEVQAMNGRLPFGQRHYWKGHFIGRTDDAFVDAIIDIVREQPAGTNSDVLIEAMHGAARSEPEGGAAFGQRAAQWNVSALGMWEDPSRDAEVIGWARRSTDRFAQWSVNGAGYGNYAPVDETPERVRAAFGQDRFARLRQLKARYDPENQFRFNHNIPPAEPPLPERLGPQ
jgi:FAD/FMN-containing dehydrogenase